MVLNKGGGGGGQMVCRNKYIEKEITTPKVKTKLKMPSILESGGFTV